MLAVKVSSNIRVNNSGAESAFRLTNARVINKVQNMVKRVLKASAPVKTGKFKRSIVLKESSRRESSGIFQGFVKVGPTALHTVFVVRRTRSSPGVYVPDLKVRIKNGIHPGTRANPFIKNSLPKIQIEAQRIVDEHYGKGRFNMARFVKRG